MCHAPAWAPSLCVCKSSDLCCSNALALCNAGRISMSSAVKASFVDCMAGEEGPQRMTRGITCTINTDMTTIAHTCMTYIIHTSHAKQGDVWAHLAQPCTEQGTPSIKNKAIGACSWQECTATLHQILRSQITNVVVICDDHPPGLWDDQHDPSKPDVLFFSTSSFTASWNHLSMQVAMQGLEFLGFLVKCNSAQQTNPLH